MVGFMLVGMSPGFAQSDLIEIGRTENARPFSHMMKLPDEATIARYMNDIEQQLTQIEQQSFHDHFFPITSTVLMPGKLVQHGKPVDWSGPPVAIIGSDKRSQQWLFKRAKKLKSIEAKVFVVSIANNASLTRLAKYFPDLSFLPMNIDPLAKKLGLTTYPCLIHKKRVWQ